MRNADLAVRVLDDEEFAWWVESRSHDRISQIAARKGVSRGEAAERLTAVGRKLYDLNQDSAAPSRVPPHAHPETSALASEARRAAGS